MDLLPKRNHVGKQTDITSSEHLSINNSRLRRSCTLIALRTTAYLHRRYDSCVRPISRWHLVKTGQSVHLTEAATMQFIANNTTIPVPKIYCSFLYKKKAYIVMKRVRGKPIHAVWSTLPEEDRTRLLQQLKGMLNELRILVPPDGRVQSCVGGSLHDVRIPHDNGTRFGPFESIQAFHLWLRGGLALSVVEENIDREGSRELVDMIDRQDGPWPLPVFTHADINPHNIIVRGAKIAAIIDWEFSGWYPHYWEYTSAWYGNLIRPYWQEQLDKILEPFPQELEMEIVRQRWWGEV